MKLINHVLDIRRLIQQAFDNRFSRMGLRKETAMPVEELPAEHQPKRMKLDELMSSHLNELGDYTEARQAAINECVFTLFNRIAAIKVMESKELFPEIICRRKENAGRSFEHNVWLENHPEERNAEREGLKHFLSDKFDSLGEHIPLYRSDYPYALLPTADELNEIIDQFNAVEEDVDCGADVWKGDDILGWLYENFNAVEKEALKQSGEKTEYNKVSLQSQVYTPHWVVKFLVDNTLGKSYLEMYPDSKIKEKYQIANAPDHQVRHPKDMRQMRVLDPACGSGNFLIYAFTLLYDLYIDQMENYGRDYSRRDIPKMIVENNLFGMDLDERAAQISQIALFIKARELGGHRSHWPEYTNVVSTHFFLPQYEELQGSFEILGSWSQKQITTIYHIWNDLRSAYKFGSLVRVEERLNEMMPNDVNHSMFKEFEMENLFEYKNNVITQLRNNVNQWGGKGSNHFTLAKANDAISFLDIISHKYDVVVANPPYTYSRDFGPDLKEFIEDNYSLGYNVGTNLYSCFITRCHELLFDEGYMGIIHPKTFMSISKFKETRGFILDNCQIDLFVDWGFLGIFPPAVRVDSAFYTLKKAYNKDKYKESTFFKLDDYYEGHRYNKFVENYKTLCDNGSPTDDLYTIDQKKFKLIKGSPFIYWISDEFREKFAGNTLSEKFDICNGISSGGNNERFYRFFWEVDRTTIMSSSNKDAYKWVTINKGGESNKWYGNQWLVFEWEGKGKKLKALKKTCPSIRYGYEEYYFKEGLAFNGSGKYLAVRIQPEFCLFERAGKSIYTKNPCDYYELMAILNSKLCSYIMGALNSTISFQSGDLERMPYTALNNKVLSGLSRQNTQIKKIISETSIIEPLYTHSPIRPAGNVKDILFTFFKNENLLNTIVLLNEAIIDNIVFSEYKLSESDKKKVIEKEGESVGNLVVSKKAKEAFVKKVRELSDIQIHDEILHHIDNLPECDSLDHISDFDTLYQSNNQWEKFCVRHSMNPIELWYQYNHSEVVPEQRCQILAFELLADVVNKLLLTDNDGIIPIGNKMGEERLGVRIEREFMERGYSSLQFNQVCQLLGCDIDKFLLNRFFSQLSNHLNLFDHMPKTPFIWHLSSGEHHAIELYVSIYKWNRDALYRVRSIYAANRETVLRDRLNSLDTSKTGGRMEAQELRATLAELQEFCQKVDDLLASGYDPKLDDGVGKNIAPLQKRNMLSYEVLNTEQLKKYLNADW